MEPSPTTPETHEEDTSSTAAVEGEPELESDPVPDAAQPEPEPEVELETGLAPGSDPDPEAAPALEPVPATAPPLSSAAPTETPMSAPPTSAGDVVAGAGTAAAESSIQHRVPEPNEFEVQQAAIKHSYQILMQRPEIGAVCPVIEDNTISVVTRKALPGDDKAIPESTFPLYTDVRRGLLSNVDGLVVPAVGIWVELTKFQLDPTGIPSIQTIKSLEEANLHSKQLRAMAVSRDIIPGVLTRVTDVTVGDGLEAMYSMGIDAKDILGKGFSILSMSDDGVETVVYFEPTDDYMVFGRMEPLAAQRVVEETYTAYSHQRRSLMMAHIEKMLTHELARVQTESSNNMALTFQNFVDGYAGSDDVKLDARPTPKTMQDTGDFCHIDEPAPLFRKRTCPSLRSQMVEG